MPPAVRTDLTNEIPEDGDFVVTTTEELIR
jgi:hypothetical protein